MELTEKEKAYQEIKKAIDEIDKKAEKHGLETFLCVCNEDSGDYKVEAKISMRTLTYVFAKHINRCCEHLSKERQNEFKELCVQEFTKLIMSPENPDEESVKIDA